MILFFGIISTIFQFSVLSSSNKYSIDSILALSYLSVNKILDLLLFIVSLNSYSWNAK